MRCALCGAVAADEPDPRMPLLRIPSCWTCRGIIAYGVGWARGGFKIARRDSDGRAVRLWTRIRTRESALVPVH